LILNFYCAIVLSMKKKPKLLEKRLKGLAIFAAIIAAILIGSFFYFQNIKGSYEKKIENLRETYLSLSKNADVIEETKRLRADFYKRRHYLDFLLKYSYSAANFLRKLSLIATEEIELLEIEINPLNQSLIFLLTGRIKADNHIEARSRFLEFYQAMKRFEDILHIESSKMNVKPGDKKPDRAKKRSPGKPGPGEKQAGLYFTISGEVEIG
jgi:hypothetical protein